MKSLSFVLLGLVSYMVCGPAELCAKLATVAKPVVGSEVLLKPRAKSDVPKGFKDHPFVDAAVAPKPSIKEKKRGYILFSRPITQPVYRKSHPQASESITQLKTFSTQGEYEPVSFSVYPLRDMKNFRVLVSPLTSEAGEIPKENVDLRLVTYWNMFYPTYTSSGNYREQPELLEKVTVNSFSKGDCQRYWLTIKTPDAAKPGLYRGTVTLFDDVSAQAIELPIQLRVLDYKLKKDPKKHFTAFHLPFHHMYRTYSGAVLEKAMAADFENMRKYGFDTFPDFYLHGRKSADGSDEFYLKDNAIRMIEKAIAVGLKGRLIVVEGRTHFYKRYVPNGKPHRCPKMVKKEGVNLAMQGPSYQLSMP